MHFTYEPDLDASTLKQGDVLEKTPQLNELLARYHSHYTSPEYTHFQVLTQSCDLVKRGSGNCSARYITIAAIRSFDTVVERAIISEAKKNVEVEGKLFCSDSHKDRLAFTISTLLNNNAKEFFYLHAAPEHKLTNHSSTFLHLSVAIKADEHYELCLGAKILELKENFRAKLGWMVGNIYSRVGTEDFVPGAISNKKDFTKYIDEVLEKHIGWVPSSAFGEFKKNATDGNGLTFDEIYTNTKQKLKENRDNKINSFASQLKSEGRLSQEQVESIKRFLNTQRGGRFIS